MTVASNIAMDIDPVWVGGYVANTLSPARFLWLETMFSMRPDWRDQCVMSEELVAYWLEGAQATPLSSQWEDQLLANIECDGQIVDCVVENDVDDSYRASHQLIDNVTSTDGLDKIPDTIMQHLEASNRNVAWEPAGIGIERILIEETKNNDHQERLYLLRAKPGFRVPIHSHRGDEWTLILKGGYKSMEKNYSAGDIHIADKNTVHNLKIDEDESCIALIYDHGSIRFKNPLFKLFEPFSKV